MFVKPAEGRTVRRPDTLVHLRAEGEEVPDGDEYWARRLRDEDVEVVDASVHKGAGGFFEIGKHADLPAPSEESQA